MNTFGSVLAFLTILFTIPSFAQTHTLTLEIEEVIPDKGELKIAIYDSEDAFMDVPNAVRTAVVDMENEGQTRFEFNALPMGTYAVAVMQDLNKNGELDMGNYGPVEPYGFSNNARGVSGPPSFEESAFRLMKDKRLSIVIREQ